MKKIKKVWEIIVGKVVEIWGGLKRNLFLFYTLSVLVNVWFAPNFWVVVIWSIYMGYSFYELLAEFVKNHRTSVNVQVKEYLKNNGYTEDKEESEE